MRFPDTSRSSLAYVVPLMLMSFVTVRSFTEALAATKLPVIEKMPLTSRRPSMESVPS